MVIRRVNDFGTPFVHPEFFLDSLTVGTVTTATVAAGIVVDFRMTALFTNADATS